MELIVITVLVVIVLVILIIAGGLYHLLVKRPFKLK
jgi:hypothetical protein